MLKPVMCHTCIFILCRNWVWVLQHIMSHSYSEIQQVSHKQHSCDTTLASDSSSQIRSSIGKYLISIGDCWQSSALCMCTVFSLLEDLSVNFNYAAVYLYVTYTLQNMNIVLLDFGSLLVTMKSFWFLIYSLKLFSTIYIRHAGWWTMNMREAEMVMAYFKVLSGGIEGNHKKSASTTNHQAGI